MTSRRALRVALLLAAAAVAACEKETGSSADAAVGSPFDAYVPPGLVFPPDAAQDASVDVPGDAASDTAADALVRCTPDSLRCRDSQTAERCARTGDAWRTFVCANGCAENACQSLLFDEGWTLHPFTLAGDPVDVPAAYTFSPGSLVTTQTRNAMASAYVFEQVFAGVEITGKFGVQTDSDDDLIGLVFGWQDPQNFYLLDWKQSGQILQPCGEAKVGVALKRVKAGSPVADCADLWDSAGTSKVSPLTDVTRNATGWKDNTLYDFRIRFQPGALRVEIKDGDATVATLTSADASFTSGKFGFYSYSQEAVRYESIRVQPLQP